MESQNFSTFEAFFNQSNASLTQNSTLESNDAASGLTILPYGVIVSVISVPVSGFIIGASCIAIGMMNMCKKLPRHIQLLSTSYIVCLMLFHIVIIATSVLMVSYGSNATIFSVLWDVRGAVAQMTVNMTSVSAVAMTLERLITLKCGMNIPDYVKLKYTRYAIAFVYLYTIVGTFLCTIIWLWAIGSLNPNWMDVGLTIVLNPTRYFAIVNMIIANVIVLRSYTIIKKIARSHLARISQVMPYNAGRVQNETRTTGPIAEMLLCFIILHIPTMVMSIAHSVSGLENVNIKTPLLSGIYFCSVILSCVSIYMYTFRFQECKMNFMKTFLSWSRKYKQEADKLYDSIYNIPVSTGVIEIEDI